MMVVGGWMWMGVVGGGWWGVVGLWGCWGWGIGDRGWGLGVGGWLWEVSYRQFCDKGFHTTNCVVAASVHQCVWWSLFNKVGCGKSAIADFAIMVFTQQIV